MTQPPVQPTTEQDRLKIRYQQWQIASERLELERRERLQSLGDADLPRLIQELQSVPVSGVERADSGLCIRQERLRQLP